MNLYSDIKTMYDFAATGSICHAHDFEFYQTTLEQFILRVRNDELSMARIKVDSHHYVNNRDSNMMFALFAGIIHLYGTSCWASNNIKNCIEMVTLAESMIADAVTHITT